MTTTGHAATATGTAPVASGLAPAGFDVRRATWVIPWAGEIPPGHPLNVLNFDTSRNSAGRIWEYAVRMASEEAGTTVLDPGEQAMLDALLDTLPADDPCRQNLAALAIFARIAERLYFSAEVTACASTWLDSHRPPLAELPALTEPDTTGPRPAGHDTAEDRPPPPDLLALTTTVLTSAPPAPAPPVSGAAAAVPVAA